MSQDSETSPELIVIARPNGAGKSTSAPTLLRDSLRIPEFVNADTIAHGLSGFSPNGAAVAAGRIMLERLHELAAARRNFAFETTLATRSYAAWFRELRNTGYHIRLTFCGCPRPIWRLIACDVGLKPEGTPSTGRRLCGGTNAG